MSRRQATVGTHRGPDLVRVSVTSGTRRVDLVLPAAVPVAELVPELARSVGLLDATSAHDGYRVVTQAGRELASGIGLAGQGVRDGVVLTVVAGVDGATGHRVYDDVVEAMADVVEHDLPRWGPALGRPAAVVGGGLLLGLGAAALLAWGGGAAGASAALVALGLVGGAIVLSRTRKDTAAAVTVADTVAVTMAATAAAYAAVAGWVLVEGPVLGAPAVAAGSGAVLVGLTALVGLGEGRVLPLPAVVVGSVLVATGLLTEASGVEPALVLTTALVLVVAAGGAAPRLALAAGTGLDQPVSLADLGTDVRDDPGSEPGGVDAEAVGADARLGHQILVAVSASVGLLLVLVAPFAVGLGRSGALVAMASCLVVLLRARRHRVRSEVLVGLVSGAGGLGSVAVSVLVLHESWRPVAAAVLVAAGTLVLSQALLSAPPSARRDWLADVAETAALVSLPPLLLLATGVVDVVRG